MYDLGAKLAPMDATNDDASRARIAAMRTEQQADLYDAVAAEFTGTGITKSVFLHNMATLRRFNEAMQPAEREYDEAVAASANQGVRDARQQWEETVERLRPSNQPRHRPMAEILQEQQEALRTYEEAIYSCGDERVTRTWHKYREALETASDAYSRRLRLAVTPQPLEVIE
jgi:hypothetical protein